jgi:hypothetical protein
MENQGHEKYVSIEYDKWENYYKPIEQKLKRVERELKEERDDKQVRITLRLDDFHRPYGRNFDLGIIKIDTILDIQRNGGDRYLAQFLPQATKDSLWKAIYNWIQEHGTSFRTLHKEPIRLLTHRDLQIEFRQQQELLETQTKGLKILEERLKEREKVIEKRYQNIPRWVKTLFRLKIN